MTILSVLLHPEWIGNYSLLDYMCSVRAQGVGGVELQLPPTLTIDSLSTWRRVAEAAQTHLLQLTLHIPVPYSNAIWIRLRRWIGELATQAPLVVLVHGAVAARPQPSLVQATVAQVRSICQDLPPTATVAVETGWNRGTMMRLSARLRHWHYARHIQQQQRQRLQGIGSGLSAGVASSALPVEEQDSVLDPICDGDRWRWWQGADLWIGTGSRDATLAIVEQVNHPRCTIAWDLAHDWLSSVWEHIDQPCVPSQAFLERVGYVRIHDAVADGTTHLPLVVGNVPYTSQLRALSRIGFDGPACVAIRYTKHAQVYGSRWQLLERSLTITRQGLRIPYQQ